MSLIENPYLVRPGHAGCGSGFNQVGTPREPLPCDQCVQITLIDGTDVGLYDESDIKNAQLTLDKEYADHERVLIIRQGYKSYDLVKRSEIVGISGVDRG